MLFLNVLMFVVAAVVAYVSYLSYRTNREKFRLDLFEKRHAIFRAVTRHLRKAADITTLEWGDITEYLQATADAPFLFDSNLTEYIDNVYKDSKSLVSSRKRLDGKVTDQQRESLSEELDRALEALVQKLQEAKQRFSPYLGFKKP